MALFVVIRSRLLMSRRMTGEKVNEHMAVRQRGTMSPINFLYLTCRLSIDC